MDNIYCKHRDELSKKLRETFEELYFAEGNGKYSSEDIRNLAEHAVPVVLAGGEELKEDGEYRLEKGEVYGWMRAALESDGSDAAAVKEAAAASLLEGDSRELEDII